MRADRGRIQSITGKLDAVEHDVLGPVRMPNVLFRLSNTPGQVRHAGRAHGADTDEVLGELDR